MSAPTIEILGVYRLPIPEELFQANYQLRWEPEDPGEDPAESLRKCREELELVVLIELVVRNVDSRFKMIDLTQTQEELPREKWQAPWAEAYLSPDGASYAGKFRESAPANPNSIRVAFFMHYWEPTKPLTTSYGEITCPPPQPMPQRLQELARYEILD